MAFTITSLGTGYQAASTSVSKGSLTWAAGDWLVAIVGNRSGTCSTIRFYDGTTAYDEYSIAAVDNSGNITLHFAIHKARTAASGSGSISATFTASDDCNIACYKLTGEEPAVKSVSAFPSITGTDNTASLTTTTTKAGNSYHVGTGTITSLTMPAWKTAGMTGTLYGRIWTGDGTLVGTLGSKDIATEVSTTTGASLTFNSSSVDIPSDGPYIIGLEVSTSGGAITYYRTTRSAPSVESVGIEYAYVSGAWVTGASYNISQTIAGDLLANYVDAIASTTGNSSTASSGATGTITAANSVGFGAIGMEEQTDEKGTWTTGAGYLEGNYQDTGATSGGSNAGSLFTTAELLSGSTAQTAEQTSTGLNQYAALAVILGQYVETVQDSLTGSSVTTSGGTLTTEVLIHRTLTGSVVTTTGGDLQPDVSIALAGSEVTSAAGSIRKARKKDLTGEEVTSTGGILELAVNLALSGEEVSVANGTLREKKSRSLIGEELSTNSGILTPVVASADVLRNLTGSQVTSTTGSLGLKVTLTLSGDEVTTNSGTVAWSKAKRKALSGSQSLTNSGILGLKVVLPLSGSEVSTESGLLFPTQNVQKALTGTTCSAESGILGTKSGRVLSGLEVLTSGGSVTPNIKIGLNGVTVTSAAGTVSAISNKVSLVGSEVITSAGNLIGYRIPEVSLIGFMDSNIIIEGEIGYNLESSGTFFNVIELENDIFV